MSTSLAEQLQRLAVPQTSILARDKTKPSLLFDPREAAGIRRETIYQIGLDGLEELIVKNPIFEQFRNSLFDITSKNFERSVQTSEDNKKLDKKIRKFLLLLSPYFLLSSSHKCLEWLINRYNIQEYNREDLLMLILPYHESNIFVRVIQTMKFKDSNDKWYFLKSLQKSGVHLTKQGLLTHAANDTYFLKFVSKFISLLLKEFDKPAQLTVAFNFYCAVFTGAIEYSKEINETQITEMLPALIKGLKSEIPDYAAASYVITAKLMTKVSIGDKLLDKIVERISMVNVRSLKTEAILVLLALYQSQNHYDQVPDVALENFVQYDWLPDVLQELNNQNCLIWSFVEPLVKSCTRTGIKSNDERHRDLVEKILNALKFDQVFVKRFLDAFLDGVSKWKSSYSEDLKAWLKRIVEIVERQYPEEFDKVVYKILSSTDEGIINKRKRCLQKIFKEGMALKGKFAVFDKLYHPNPQFRVQAIEYLAENFNLLREAEKEMIKSSILDRLVDDSVVVVQETLSLIQSITVLEFDENLKKMLYKLSWKCQKDLKNWGTVAGIIAILLSRNSQPNDWGSFLAIFPHLLPGTDDELLIVKEIFKTNFIKNHPLKKLRLIKADTVETPEEFCNLIFDSLESDNLDLIKEFVDVLVKTPQEERDVFHRYLATLILSCMLPDNSPIEINSLVIEIFALYFDGNILLKHGNVHFRYHFQLARRGKFSLEGFLSYIKKVILKTSKTDVILNRHDFSVDNDFNRYFVHLANLLFVNTTIYKKYCKQFLNHFFKNFKDKVEFMLNLALSNNKLLDKNFVENTIELVTVLIEEAPGLNDFVNLDGILVPYLLILLMDSCEKVRRKSLKVIEALTNKIEDRCNNYYWLIRELLNQKEEIMLDDAQIPLVIFNLLQPSKYRARNSKLTPYRNALLKAACNKENPIYAQAGILKLLSHINNIEVFNEISQLTLDILNTDTINFDNVRSSIIINTINRCDSNVSKDIKLDSDVWKFITFLLRHDQIRVRDDDSIYYASVLMLNQFNREFMAILPEDVTKNLLDIIIEITTITKNTEILPASSHIFKHIDLDGRLIVDYFVKMRNVQSPKLDPSKLKRRISIVPTIDILDTLEWRLGVTVLEFIQDKKKIRYLELLLPVLFDVLKKCLDFDEQAGVEYPKQLILSSILHCCNKLEKDSIPENVFNVELIVQCIRASQNPQTHHHALLVLAQSATIIPNQVLHHIMAIFTFMGSSVLRHDDAYSYQIISKIIDTIIPILVEGDNIDSIAKVLRVFVDALLDVPEHRRLPLYKQLLMKIGVKDNLYIFLLLIFESHVFNNQLRTQTKGDDLKKRLEIAASFCCEFAPYIVINNCISLIKFLKELPDEIKENGSEQFAFNIRFNTPKQFRHFKYTLITFTANFLSSKEFVNQIAALNESETFALEIEYKDVIVHILQYIQRVSKIAEKNANTPQSQYWKVILHHSYDILDSVNALVTPQMFILVIKGLTIHSLNTVKRRAMEVLNSKLQYNPIFFEKCKYDEIYSLIPSLISIIKTIEQQPDQDQELLIQTALLSLKLLIKLLAGKNPEKFLDILDFITDIIKSGKAQNNVLASVVLCLAELCVNLRAHSIASLPNFMPPLIKILKQQKNQESPNLLLLSTITALQKIVDTLHNFMSPYLEKILIELSSFVIKSDDQKMQPFNNKIKLIREKIATAIPPRILLPTISDAYNSLIEKSQFSSIGPLMIILKESLSHLVSQDITTNLSDLTKFFLNALQFRSDNKASYDETNLVEDQIVAAFSTFALKLSESTFRPLYQDVFHWAQLADERLITFYHLSSEVANNLKGLFVLFASHFINNSAQILKDCNKFDDEQKNILLLENVLKTLLAVFTFDSQKFVNKERFEILMPVIVDQLENTVGGDELFEKRCQDLVIPCIVQFTVAVADDSLWKRLNYAVLLKSKHKSARIRLLTLNCLTQIVTKIGEDFLPLLPETIPFLAELLEDEEEEVEKECRKSVQNMEKLLGEPIQKYF